MKQYDALRINIMFIQTNDICTSSPIWETGINFSDFKGVTEDVGDCSVGDFS